MFVVCYDKHSSQQWSWHVKTIGRGPDEGLAGPSCFLVQPQVIRIHGLKPPPPPLLGQFLTRTVPGYSVSDNSFIVGEYQFLETAAQVASAIVKDLARNYLSSKK